MDGAGFSGLKKGGGGICNYKKGLSYDTIIWIFTYITRVWFVDRYVYLFKTCKKLKPIKTDNVCQVSWIYWKSRRESIHGLNG